MRACTIQDKKTAHIKIFIYVEFFFFYVITFILSFRETEGKSGLDLPYSEEVPEDLKAFFGHPLTAAETALHGDALALLHEYQHLPSLDKADLRLNDKNEIFNDILR